LNHRFLLIGLKGLESLGSLEGSAKPSKLPKPADKFMKIKKGTSLKWVPNYYLLIFNS